MLSKHKMSDSPSSDLSSDGSTVRKTRSSSIFTIPRLFVGFSTKGLMDLDPTRSPTSPLDIKSPKYCDYNTAGLGLLNYLTDEVKPVNKLLGSPLKLNSTKSLPKNYGLLIKGSPKYNLGSQEMVIRPNLLHDEFGKMRSCSADLGGSGSDKPDLGHLKSGLNESLLGRSLPISIHSLSAREIEQSEDYTCIKSYGPNAKTTHIFGDCILEPHVIESPDNFLNNKGETKGIGFSQSESKNPIEPPLCPDIDFLSACFACEKRLDGKDVYIYRGEKAFCSASCRDEEISREEDSEKHYSDLPLSFDSTEDDIFMAGMVVAT